MTEMVSKVYDLIYPSPATLKEISCNELVTALWRWKVENRVTDDLMPDLDLHKNLDPNIPSPVKRIIDECINRFISSKEEWSDYHYENLFYDRNDRPMSSILLNFCDFVIDRDGTIDYIRTAKRMMTCDRLYNDEKFKIACMYCFEDDITRIWPSASDYIDINEIEFYRSPELFYWVSKLIKSIFDVGDERDDSIDDSTMLNTCSSTHWSSVEYFWNRISPEGRLSNTLFDLSHFERESFVRLMLPKLSDQQLERFVLERGSHLIHDLVTESQYKFYALPTWMYIKNKMNENNFAKLIELFMQAETDYHFAEDSLPENSIELGDRSSNKDQTYLCCEIWRNSPDEWKRSAIKNILTQDRLFVRLEGTSPSRYREIGFLLTLLSDASFEERNDFWKKNWRNLIVDTRGKDLHRMMKLCFRNENDIAKFKETIMSDYESISERCIKVLQLGYFEQANDILTFCCPDIQKRMDLKQRLLRSCISDESFVLKIEHLTQVKSINDFINDAFDDADVTADFKNNFMSYCGIEYVLHKCTHLNCEYSSDHLIRFIDTFVSNEEVRNLVKQHILELVRNWLLHRHRIQRISADDLQTILVWCLGNEEEVTKFKKSESPMRDFFAIEKIWKECTPLEMKMNDEDVGGFLKWYFRNPEEIDEFNTLFADRFTV
ncbi:uncharacterized protein LOC135834500 isoform X10 [Planococcus citri]|uniref:uncharacterized protein LOC135834500 isoform X10 n=1 Tax=Planococcus citri TaxID=170843 RepID=UPI0031F99334